MKNNILFVLVLILITNCSSDDTNVELITIESTLIAKDNLYGNGAEGIAEQNLVIANQMAWDNLMNQMDSVNTTSDNFSETDIDFSKFKIIAAFDEIKGNGGHSIELNIKADAENIVVKVTDFAPEGNATTVITQPFHIVKIIKYDLPILFE